MRKIIAICCSVLMTMWYSVCFANGGPIDGSAFSKTGEIKPVKKTSLQIEEETLLLVIKGDYVEVSVNYEINNTSDKDEEITFSFPVEMIVEDGYESSDDDLKIQYQKDVVKEYSLLLNGKTIFPQTRKDSVPTADGSKRHKNTLWHTSILTFDAKKKSMLVVSYKIRANYEDYSYSKSPLPEFNERTFTYSFTAAAGFGNGRAKKLSVIIDTSDIIKRNGTINTVSFVSDTLQTQASGKKTLLKFDASNFDFAKATDLKISYANDAAKLTEYFQQHKPEPKNIVSLKASSTLQGPYRVENLLDGDLSTAWCEGAKGNGEGEWVEFSVKNFVLEAVFLINGYTKNQISLENNSRASLVHVTKLAKDPAYEETKLQESQKKTRLLGYEDFFPLEPLSFADWVLNTFDSAPESTVRITIRETTPGKKFSDTCISEIYLLGYPVVNQDKK